jgi:hypothetical protein
VGVPAEQAEVAVEVVVGVGEAAVEAGSVWRHLRERVNLSSQCEGSGPWSVPSWWQSLELLLPCVPLAWKRPVLVWRHPCERVVASASRSSAGPAPQWLDEYHVAAGQPGRNPIGDAPNELS